MDIDQEAECVDNPVKMEVDDDIKANEESGEQQTKCDISSEIKDETKTEESLKVLKNSSEVKDDTKNEESSNAVNKVESILDLKNEEVRMAGSSKEDDDEKVIHLTVDETKQYLLKKIGEYMMSPINPLYSLKNKAKELEEKGREQVEDYIKLYKGLQMLQRKHEIFLRSIEILPKVTMCHACVSANLPMEPIPHHESLLKKELSITKVTTPSKTTNNTSPAQSNSKPAAKPSNIECIDLTDDDLASSKNAAKSSSNPPFSMVRHPAPLPPRPPNTGSINNQKPVPSKPRLKISAEDKGIVLQWDMPTQNNCDPISNFEIFGYQEQKNTIINTLLWKKIGTVKAMTLPMACTLTQFVDGNKYHFAIRAVDSNGRCGHYSDAISIVYKQKVPQNV